MVVQKKNATQQNRYFLLREKIQSFEQNIVDYVHSIIINLNMYKHIYKFFMGGSKPISNSGVCKVGKWGVWQETTN